MSGSPRSGATSARGAGGRLDADPLDGRAGALVDALREARARCSQAAEALLDEVPDTGDHRTSRVVDDFVDQAVDTLRALDQALAETIATTRRPAGVLDTPSDPRRPPAEPGYGVPRGWRR